EKNHKATSSRGSPAYLATPSWETHLPDTWVEVQVSSVEASWSDEWHPESDGRPHNLNRQAVKVGVRDRKDDTESNSLNSEWLSGEQYQLQKLTK
ncbi:unnamed protein product, partial [Rangifer tarandus platyrhynchus]